MEWSVYNHLFFSKRLNSYLLYSSLSNMLISLDQQGFAHIDRIRQNPDCKVSKEYEFLNEGHFLVESNQTECNKLKLTQLRSRFNPYSLSLTIAPTRACNFNCPYCYEKDRANKKMTKKVQNALIDFVKKQSDVKRLHVAWYGGEPTLSYSTIKYLSAEFQKINNNYSAMMITNGYLLDKMTNFLDELKINHLQITLDGIKETHDKTRCLLNGAGTFDKVLSNIELLLNNHKIGISIRMNIDRENATYYIQLLRLLEEKFGNKVHLYPAFVTNYGGGCRADSCYEDSFQKALFLKQLYEKEGIYSAQMYPFRAQKGCMMQAMNSFVVGPEGELYKCWHHLGVKEKEIGSILSPTIVTNFGLLADEMVKGDVLFDAECYNCVLFPSCYGGCTDMKVNTKKTECIPFKTMLEEFLEMRYEMNDRSKIT